WRQVRRAPLTLRAGARRLDVEVHDPHQSNPFLLACVDTHEQDASRRLAWTDDSWTMRRDPQDGWSARDHLDDARDAWAFDGVWAEPWGLPCDAPDDFLRLSHGWQRWTTSRPAVLDLGGGLGVAEQDARGHLTFHAPTPRPPTLPDLGGPRPGGLWQHVRDAHATITNEWLELYETRAPRMVLDAGAETFARVRVRVIAGGEVTLAVTTAESRGELDRYRRRLTDVVTVREGESFATSPTGWRYASVQVLASDGPAVLAPVEAQHVRFPAPQQGSFACSDDLVTRAYDLSGDTLRLCMQNEVWDGPKRDQRPWMGDLHVAALAAYQLFGDHRLVRRTLEVLAELGPAPERPLETRRSAGLSDRWRTRHGDINDIPTYTLWWLAGLRDYHLHVGDDLASVLADEARATVAHVLAHVDDEGRWRFRSGWNYVDWAPLTPEEREAYTHVLACHALEGGLALLEELGDDLREERAAIERMRAQAVLLAPQGEELDGARAHHLSA
ncbi:hypothetical protein, partial [Deinococcus pimensis]|uniref:alpha-L-rhamnosidase-related protein n=1 Tax=Deinococcus pimensis TaxID=309888 RepID=UPI00146FBBB3